jgi:hypothetical protein
LEPEGTPLPRSTTIGIQVVVGTAIALAGCAHGGPVPTAGAKAAGAVEARAQATLADALGDADRARFAALDADGDGRLTPAELAELPPAAFRAIDADGDGTLTPAEATAQAAPIAARARAALAFTRARRLAEAPAADERAERAAVARPLAMGEAEAAAAAIRAEAGASAATHGPTDAPAPELASAGPPVVIVPGYLDGAWYFGLVRSRVHAARRGTHVLPLFPNVCDITLSAQRLRAFVEQVKAETGAAKVDLVAHSEGGLISRHYIRFLGGEAHVGRLVTLGTPHHGTVLGYLGPGMGAHQMQPGSDFLKALNAGDESWGEVAYTSIRAGLDEIILPHSSPIQEGAANHEVSWIEHGTLLTSKRAFKHVLDGLAR